MKYMYSFSVHAPIICAFSKLLINMNFSKFMKQKNFVRTNVFKIQSIEGHMHPFFIQQKLIPSKWALGSNASIVYIYLVESSRYESEGREMHIFVVFLHVTWSLYYGIKR